MRVLVTGASGFVGRAARPALQARGHEVVGAARNPGQGLGGVEIRRIPDIDGETDWTEALDGIEAVVHLAARVHVMKETAEDPTAAFRRINLDGARALAEQAAKAGVARLVYVSTVKVNGEASADAPFRESDPPAPADPYGESKMHAEKALLQIGQDTGMEVVCVRPPLVYGPGAKGNFLSLLKLCRKGLPLPLGAVDNRRSLIYLGNLADAIAVCVDHPAASGRTFLVRDGEDVSTAELIHRVCASLGTSARLFPAPASLLRLAGSALGKQATVSRLLDSLAVDDGEIRRTLGWTPPHTLDQGLRETADWFLSGID